MDAHLAPGTPTRRRRDLVDRPRLPAERLRLSRQRRLRRAHEPDGALGLHLGAARRDRSRHRRPRRSSQSRPTPTRRAKKLRVSRPPRAARRPGRRTSSRPRRRTRSTRRATATPRSSSTSVRRQSAPTPESSIEIVSSYRPATRRPASRPVPDPVPASVTVGRHSTEEGGLLGVVGIAAAQPPTSGSGSPSTCAPTTPTLWPDTVADDAILWRLRLGVQVRDGASAQVHLRSVAVRARPQELRRRDARCCKTSIASTATRYPNITQYAASEISLVHAPQRVRRQTARCPNYTSADRHQGLDASPRSARWSSSCTAMARRSALNHPLHGRERLRRPARRLITHPTATARDVIEIGTGQRTRAARPGLRHRCPQRGLPDRQRHDR